MDDAAHSFRLRYVGARFERAQLPLDVLSDLPAFRDLLVAYAKQKWRDANADRKRIPKGFDKSLSFDLVGVDEGSAIPNIKWNEQRAQALLPGVAAELGEIVNSSYQSIVDLIDLSAQDVFPKALDSEQVRALNRLGDNLREDERIEFVGSTGHDGNVVYLDSYRRKKLITKVRETYESRVEGIGWLIGVFLDDTSGRIVVSSEQYGSIDIWLEADRVRSEFDGNLGASVQFDLQVELSNKDELRRVIWSHGVALVDALDADAQKCLERLNILSNLPNGWHDGKGSAIAARAINAARLFIYKRPGLGKGYRIYPTTDGGLLFEFEANQWDLSLEFLPSGCVEFFGVSLEGADEIDPLTFQNVGAELLEMFDHTVGAA